MTQSIRDAARALYSACCNYGSQREQDIRDAVKAYELAALRDAISTPRPTADERVAELMRHVIRLKNMARSDFAVEDLRACEQTVEQSARALLSTSQEDAEHAAMYRWLRSGIHSLYITTGDLAGDCEYADMVPAGLQGSIADAAIRSAMSAKETK